MRGNLEVQTIHHIAVVSGLLSENRSDCLGDLLTIPKNLAECLREAKSKSISDFVIVNSEGGPLSYTQFKRVWQYIVTRSF